MQNKFFATYFSVSLLASTVFLLLVCSIHTFATAQELSVSGSWNLRYEQLTNPLFPTSDDRFHQHNQRLSSKFRVKGVASWSQIRFVGEFADSRVYLDNDDPTLTRAQVNTFEPVQFNFNWVAKGSHPEVLSLDQLSIGRFVLDYGSGRLIASGNFRNALNTFDGVIAQFSRSQWQVHSFYLLPVSRLPASATAVDNNEQAFDKSEAERRLYGMYIQSPEGSFRWQTYWFDEKDGPILNTANREILTIGMQYILPEESLWLGNAELIIQSGTRRQTTSSDDLKTLQHQAWMAHLEFGKMTSATTSVQAIIDLVSGDNNAGDNRSNNFDTLYGVRRFDYGPTDVYQAMPRRNLTAFGAKLETRITDNQQLLLRYLAFRYQRTPQGSNVFIGNQLEFRWRYQLTQTLRWETGGAYMFKGKALAQGLYPDDTAYGYCGFQVTF